MSLHERPDREAGTGAAVDDLYRRVLGDPPPRAGVTVHAPIG